jgi:hypothetical protein
VTPTLFDAVRACSIVLLSGAVLHACDVTAGNGSVTDWRAVKSGETLCTGGDAFDTAYLFVTLVGPEAAIAAATRHQDIEPAPPGPRMPVRITAFARDEHGGRRRQFDAGPFTVRVEPHEDDAAQAAFAEALARAAQELV